MAGDRVLAEFEAAVLGQLAVCKRSSVSALSSLRRRPVEATR